MELKHQLEVYRSQLVRFLRNPIQEIKNVPQWSWNDILLFTGLITAAVGLLAGIVEKNVFMVISFPLLTLILTGVAALFFYYGFQIFAGKTISVRQIFLLLIFANIPFFIFQIGASLIPPLILVGFAFTALLLIVGFTENFQIPRKVVVRFMAALYLVIAFIWIVQMIESSRLIKSLQKDDFEAPEVHLGQ
ncbi:MAG: YIP1 family protein [Pseudobdellovibrionaceae bacterium]